LKEGSYLVAEQVPKPDLVGQPIHVFDQNGRILRSFGSRERSAYRADQPRLATRLVASDDVSLWAVAPGRYVLERWNPGTGELMTSTTVQSGWFKETASSRQDERVRPDPIIEALWVTEGLAWVLIRDADLDWKPPVKANVERVISATEYEDTYDWVLEAVDTQSGRVIASRRFRSGLWARPPDGLIASRVDDAGSMRVDLWRAGLQRKEKRP
jgi:hypothetical protein